MQNGILLVSLVKKFGEEYSTKNIQHVKASGQNYMDFVVKKPVFGVSAEVIFKPACSATETSEKIKISIAASLDIILSKK